MPMGHQQEHDQVLRTQPSSSAPLQPPCSLSTKSSTSTPPPESPPWSPCSLSSKKPRLSAKTGGDTRQIFYKDTVSSGKSLSQKLQTLKVRRWVWRMEEARLVSWVKLKKASGTSHPGKHLGLFPKELTTGLPSHREVHKQKMWVSPPLSPTHSLHPLGDAETSVLVTSRIAVCSLSLSASSVARLPALSDTQPGPSSLSGPAAWPAGTQSSNHSPWWRQTCLPSNSAGGGTSPTRTTRYSHVGFVGDRHTQVEVNSVWLVIRQKKLRTCTKGNWPASLPDFLEWSSEDFYLPSSVIMTDSDPSTLTFGFLAQLMHFSLILLHFQHKPLRRTVLFPPPVSWSLHSCLFPSAHLCLLSPHTATNMLEILDPRFHGSQPNCSLFSYWRLWLGSLRLGTFLHLESRHMWL